MRVTERMRRGRRTCEMTCGCTYAFHGIFFKRGSNFKCKVRNTVCIIMRICGNTIALGKLKSVKWSGNALLHRQEDCGSRITLWVCCCVASNVRLSTTERRLLTDELAIIPGRVRSRPQELPLRVERYFYFLESGRDHGLLVFDAVDKGADQRFVRQLERYFIKTQTGRYRTTWEEFGPWLHELQYRGRAQRDGRTYESYGITYVPNPYGEGRA